MGFWHKLPVIFGTLLGSRRSVDILVNVIDTNCKQLQISGDCVGCGLELSRSIIVWLSRFNNEIMFCLEAEGTYLLSQKGSEF